ncbi:helix-turn-helix domain-containing protein [Sulfobacillus thermosulfidooxidans]|uniref:helix-turn-helix domain-containing protein n=1 Tax=Sulfobacillus thermosulfidooxidans TaxID=28034 RepID=UPI0006B48690|nr:helix-turn-helix transcriptional regulator [Sulfobacillus thermosulfidooxidans]
MGFGQILRTLREERHLTQHDLVAPGLSRTLISHYEHERRLPSFEHVQYLAQRLQVATDVFFGGHGMDTAHAQFLHCLKAGEQAERREHWADAQSWWDHALWIATTFHFVTWIPLIHWHQVQTAWAQQQWKAVVQWGVPLLVHGQSDLSREDAYRLFAILGHAHRELDQLSTAELFYQLAQTRSGIQTEQGLKMMINRASCRWLLGDCREAARLFDGVRHEAADHHWASLEAWAQIGWTTAQLSQDRPTDCLEALDRAAHLADALADLALQQAVQQNRLVIARMRGQWNDVDHIFSELRTLRSPLPLSWITERLYWCGATGAWEEGQEWVRKAEQCAGLGQEVRDFWRATAVFFQAWGSPRRSALAQRLATLQNMTLAESLAIFRWEEEEGASNDMAH